MSHTSDTVDGDTTETVSSGGVSFGDIGGTILTKFVQVLEATLILIAAYFLIRWLKTYFTKVETAHEQQRTALNLMEKITNGFIVVIGITLALKTVGLDISLLVSVGLLGLSYGLKDVIKNYVAGILIFFKAPFKIGDVVKIKHYTGKVEKMDFQSTSLKTFDHRDITIYNSDIMTQSIENYSRYPVRRMEIDVKLGYGSDLEKATRLFETILTNDPLVQKSPKYSIIFKKFMEDCIVVQLKFWVAVPSNMLAIRSNIAFQIQQAFDEESIFAPYVKGIEAEGDFTLNTERKSRIKTFYGKPLLTDIAKPVAATVNAEGQPPIEILDADEPGIDDDL